MHIDAGSYVNCSVIAFDMDDRKSVRGQMAVAIRIHTYIVGPIIKAPYKPNLLFNNRRQMREEKKEKTKHFFFIFKFQFITVKEKFMEKCYFILIYELFFSNQ